MKIAFVLYDGFSMLDLAALSEPIMRQASDNLVCELCAPVTDIYSSQGIHFYPTCVTSSLAGYDWVIVPGGLGARACLERTELLDWLRTAQAKTQWAACAEGTLLLAAAGPANGKRAAADLEMAKELASYGAQAVVEAVVTDPPLYTATGAAEGLGLSQLLCRLIDTQAIPAPMPGIPVTGQAPAAQPRQANLKRQTGETEVEVRLNLDGNGQHEIDTGLPFLDHMLAQVAVHGLFDLEIRARGDLQIDPHHTMEDVALTLGTAFQQALGDKAGIVRMASAECPMDESLAWVALDFSGRPYAVIHADWHSPSVGGLPVSLFAHFLESFAFQAHCTLHTAVRYGRDDHHQAEAIFKALGRALSAATRIDPRRVGRVPSSKGILF